VKEINEVGSLTSRNSVTVALLIVAVFSVSYVLVSPDCGDDVDGFVQSNRLIRAQPSVASSLSQYQTPVIVLFRFGTLPRFIQPAAMAEILDLGCARRC
jgi:hypothetical protein